MYPQAGSGLQVSGPTASGVFPALQRRVPVPAAPKGRPHRAWGPRPRPNARLPQTAAMAHCWLPRGRGELEAARAEWHAMDKTDERVAMRRARNLAMSRSAPHREGDSARRAKARREKRDRERAFSNNI